MASILPGFGYDIFISYRHNDNRSGWVTNFVEALQEELASTLKEPVSVYFDLNPHDGLSETHDVDELLREKLKCLVFIPIISQTYCDQKSFAWNHEFLPFRTQAQEDPLGLKVKLQNGNVSSRILPVRIHNIDRDDIRLIETETGSVLRPVDFIYSSTGVVRPLLANEIDPKSNQEHFGIGMMDEILNDLFKLSDLRVISRTSSKSYKGSKKPLRQIAGELSVANILEGSVQKNGESIRIRVQLIDGRTDTQLWGETYERKYKVVFTIQSEIARAVANALKVKISHKTEESIKKPLTDNIEAYDLYLKAVTYSYWEKADPGKAFDEDVQLLNKAISLDPGFAEAYSRLSMYWISQGLNSGTLTSSEVLSKVNPLLDKALKLDPDLLSAHANSALLHFYIDLDLQKVENEYKRIKQLSPSNSIANSLITEYLTGSGRSDEALEVARKVFQDDGKSSINWCVLAKAYYYNNQPDKALETVETAATLFPGNDLVRRNLIEIRTFEAKYESAVQSYEMDTMFFKDIAAPIVLAPVSLAYLKTGRISKAKELLCRKTNMSNISPVRSPSFFSSALYSAMGDKENGFTYLKKAIDNHEVEIFWTKVYPLFSSLHDDPRWTELINKLKYPGN